MATREENLKKINEELEKLSDEELEKVSGGLFGVDWELIKAAWKAMNNSGNTKNNEPDSSIHHH